VFRTVGGTHNGRNYGVVFMVFLLDKNRCLWPLGLGRRPVVARVLGLRVRIPREAWMSVCCEIMCCQVTASKECGLEVNTDKTKYLVMARDQNAGRSHSMKIDNSSIERVEVFRYLVTTLTGRNSIQEEIKSD
jgi:hypothetical protein